MPYISVLEQQRVGKNFVWIHNPIGVQQLLDRSHQLYLISIQRDDFIIDILKEWRKKILKGITLVVLILF